MSIVALKRKTAALHNNLSVNQKQFSINGTTRNQGYIGQTSLTRSLIHTPSKGAVLKNFNGHYANPNIKASETISLEDNTVVKPSVLSFKGMMAKRERWITRPFPHAVVKPDAGQNVNAQTDYITRLKKKTLSDIEANCPPDIAKTTGFVPKKPCSTVTKTLTGAPLFTPENVVCKIAKPESTYTSISQAAYLDKLQKKCTDQDVYKFVSPMKRTPIRGGVI
jgi:hypothetical protein